MKITSILAGAVLLAQSSVGLSCTWQYSYGGGPIRDIPINELKAMPESKAKCSIVLINDPNLLKLARKSAGTKELITVRCDRGSGASGDEVIPAKAGGQFEPGMRVFVPEGHTYRPLVEESTRLERGRPHIVKTKIITECR